MSLLPQVIDMRRSKLAVPSSLKTKEEKEEHIDGMYQNGLYEFQTKEYITYGEADVLPDYWFTWERYNPYGNPPYREIQRAKYQENYSPVTRDDPYIPEGTPVNEAGYFQHGDLILLKRALREHLLAKEEESIRTQKGARAKLLAFHEKMRKSDAEIPDKDLERLLGNLR